MICDVVDVTSGRAYSAEHSLKPQRPLRDMNAVNTFVGEVVASDLWRAFVPYDHQVHVVTAPRCAHESWFERDRPFEFQTGTLAVHPGMRWTLNLLHELSHGAAPKYGYVNQSSETSVRTWPPHLERHRHGGLWASTLLRFVRDFAPEWHQQLRVAYEHYEVQLLADDALLAAVLESHRAEAELAAWDASVTGDERSWGRYGIQRQQEEPSQNLQPALGTLIVNRAFQFGEGNRSVDRLFTPLADAVGRVVACTPSDLKAITNHDTVAELRDATSNGEGRRLVQIAMAALIVLDVDAVFIRTELGLTPSKAGLTSSQVAALNDGWRTRLKHLDDLARQRPSRWTP
jgi:hypothetical protein